MNRRTFFLHTLSAAIVFSAAAGARADDSGEDPKESDSGGETNDHTSDSSTSSDSSNDSSSNDSTSSDTNNNKNKTSGSSEADGDSDDGSRDNDGDHDDDQYQARRAVQSDEALPLTAMLAIFKKQVGGQVIDVRLVRVWFQLRYKFTYIDTGGAVRLVYFDAKTGTLVD